MALPLTTVLPKTVRCGSREVQGVAILQLMKNRFLIISGSLKIPLETKNATLQNITNSLKKKKKKKTNSSNQETVC